MIRQRGCRTPTLFLPLLGGGKSLRRARCFVRHDARVACSSLRLKGGGMGWGSRGALRCLATFAMLAVSGTADAHGFGQRYDLPLPLSLYLFGAAAAVAVTFLIVALVVRSAPESRVTARVDLLSVPPTRWIAHEGVGIAARLAVLALFVVTMLAGFFGSQDPFRNIAPTLV